MCQELILLKPAVTWGGIAAAGLRASEQLELLGGEVK